MTDNLHKTSSFTQHMLSGAVAGTTEHLAMYPVDTIKTRMQASTSNKLSQVKKRINRIWRKECEDLALLSISGL